MSDEVVMLVFPSRETVLDTVDRINALGYAKIIHRAMVAKAEDGETTVYEDDVNVNEGEIAGGMLGGLLGALGIAGLGAFLLPGVGPIIAVGVAAVAGGLVGGAAGGATAKLVDLGINNKQIDALTAHLGAGKVALIVELEGASDMLSRLEEDLKPFEVEIVRQ